MIMQKIACEETKETIKTQKDHNTQNIRPA